jgi:hypothetical protein
VKDRYKPFLAGHRQVSFLNMLMESGQTVKAKYEPGALVKLCAACPQPNKNMDPNWRVLPPEEEYAVRLQITVSINDDLFFSYINALAYAKDGNFQLSQHNKKMDQLDLPFTYNGGSFADELGAKQYVASIAGKSDHMQQVRLAYNVRLFHFSDLFY